MSFNYEIKNGTIVTPTIGRRNTSSDSISAWSTPEDYDDSNDSHHSSSEDQASAPPSTSTEQQQQLEERVSTPREGSLESYAIHPGRRKMKTRRTRRTAGGALGGCIVGGLVLGPIGIVVGAPVGAYATNKICKKGERRAQRKFEHENFQKIASTSLVHSGELV
jgi:hypothetical protein